MNNDLHQLYREQAFPNDYQLVNGVEMHQQNGEQFQVPHPVLKKYLALGHFVELRIDSPRFSVHEDAPEKCSCPSCHGDMTKPILRHEHPASLVPLPPQQVPSRGWGEDFWVQIRERDGDWFVGCVDNPLAESRLHELNLGDTIVFHADHVLAVHGLHREELVLAMDATDLKALAAWLGRD
jgi:hypothetical protein